MRHSLPDLLTGVDLPAVELQAAALDGELYATGDAWRSVADLDDSVSRAGGLRERYGERIVVAGRSAAWVWGARGPAPLPHQGVVSHRSRHKSATPGLSVREVVIDDDEIVRLGHVRVTTPARTVVDVARLSSWSRDDEVATRDVCDARRVTLGQSLALLDRRQRVPHRLRAVARLRSVLDPLG